MPDVVTQALALDFDFINKAESVHDNHVILLLCSSAVIVLGLLGSYFFYGRGPSEDRLEKDYGLLYHLLYKHGWFDDLYDGYVAKIQQPIANILSFLDTVLISGLIVRGSASILGMCSWVTRSFHVGSIHAYIYWFLAGILLFGAFAMGIIS